MMILGAVLLLLGYFLHVQLLLIIGVVLLVVGVVLMLVPVGGVSRRYY